MSQHTTPRQQGNVYFWELCQEHLRADSAKDAHRILDATRRIIMYLPPGDSRLSYWHLHAAKMELRLSETEQEPEREQRRRERALHHTLEGIRCAERYPEPHENYNLRLRGIDLLRTLGRNDLAHPLFDQAMRFNEESVPVRTTRK